MFRNYDWDCTRCGHTRESVVEFPQGTAPPKQTRLSCETCRRVVVHVRRRVNLPAEYLGERPLNVSISGGNFDTMGHKRLPALPEFKGETGRDLRDFVRTKEYQEAKKARSRVKRENRAKKVRASALKRGENVSMRHSPLPGDPNWKD